MQTACRELRGYLADELNLTPDDALVVRGAALTKADYFRHYALWNDECLDGRYLPLYGGGRIEGDYDSLVKIIAPGLIKPDPGKPVDFSDQVNELCRTLARGPVWADPRLTVNEPGLLPTAFFDEPPQEEFWKAAPEEIAVKLGELTLKGCICGRVAGVQRDPRKIRFMAIFGRTIWPAGDDYRGWREVPKERPIVPLLTEWTNDDPPKLTDVLVESVPTMRQDYKLLSDADWPSGDKCGIKGPKEQQAAAAHGWLVGMVHTPPGGGKAN